MRQYNTLKRLAESLSGNTLHTGALSPELSSVIQELNTIKATVRQGLTEVHDILEEGTHLKTFKEELYKETLQPLAEGLQQILSEVDTVKKLTEAEKTEREELEKLFNEFLDLFGDRDADVKEKLETLVSEKASVEEVLEKMTSVFEAFMEVKDNADQMYEKISSDTTDILEDLSDRVKRLSDIVFRNIINTGAVEEPSAAAGAPVKPETPAEEKPAKEAPPAEEEPAEAEPEAEEGEEEEEEEKPEEETAESLTKKDLLSRLSEIREEADKIEETLKEMEDIPSASMSDLEPPKKKEEEEEKTEEKLESPVGGDAPAPAAPAAPEAKPDEEKAEEKPAEEGEPEGEEKEDEEEETTEESEAKDGQSLTESLLEFTKKALSEGAGGSKIEREAEDDEPFRESEEKPEEESDEGDSDGKSKASS